MKSSRIGLRICHTLMCSQYNIIDVVITLVLTLLYWNPVGERVDCNCACNCTPEVANNSGAPKH